jgi:hypothetical protein
MIPCDIPEDLLYSYKEEFIFFTHCMRKKKNSQMEADKKVTVKTKTLSFTPLGWI